MVAPPKAREPLPREALPEGFNPRVDPKLTPAMRAILEELDNAPPQSVTSLDGSTVMLRQRCESYGWDQALGCVRVCGACQEACSGSDVAVVMLSFKK